MRVGKSCEVSEKSVWSQTEEFIPLRDTRSKTDWAGLRGGGRETVKSNKMISVWHDSNKI